MFCTQNEVGYKVKCTTTSTTVIQVAKGHRASPVSRGLQVREFEYPTPTFLVTVPILGYIWKELKLAHRRTPESTPRCLI